MSVLAFVLTLFKSHRPFSKIVLLLFLTAAVGCIGCYQAPSAPRIEYDPADVNTIRQQVKTIVWR